MISSADQYYIELPSVTFNKLNLQKLLESDDLEWKLYWLPEWGNSDDYDETYKNHDIDIENYEKFTVLKEIIDQLPPAVRFAEMCRFKKFPKNFVHGLHKDNEESSWSSKRKAFIHIPISDNASAINFHNDEKQFVCKLKYTVPTLVNTQQYHIIDTPIQTRTSLQITMPHHYNWEEVKNLILQHL